MLYRQLKTVGMYQIYASEKENPVLKLKTVYKCFYKKYNNLQSNKYVIRLVDEYNMMKQLNHENVTKVFGITIVDEKDKPNIMLEMEQANQDFSQYLQNNPSFKNSIKFLFHVACGLNYLHQKNIAHNDIKLENIFLFSISGKLKIAKIGDFGYSRYQNFIPDSSRNKQWQFWKDRNKLNQSPQIKDLINQTEENLNEIEQYIDEIKNDIYQFGNMMMDALMNTRDLYLISEENIYNCIQQKYHNNVSSSCVNHLKNLIDNCIAHNPSYRFSAQQIMHHPFFEQCLNRQMQKM